MPRCCLPARHTISKAETLNIERHNLNFRTHLKRLHRRTICFSKSSEMHAAVIKLYVHHDVVAEMATETAALLLLMRDQQEAAGVPSP